MTVFWVFFNGEWIGYKPLEGIDPTFTESDYRCGAVAYATALQEGKTVFEAHCSAEAFMFSNSTH